MRQGRINAVARTEDIDHHHADQHGHGRNEDGEAQALGPRTTEGLQVAHLGHPDDEGREQQGQDQHEQQAQEYLSRRARDVGGQPLHPTDVAPDGQIDDEAACETDQKPDQHQHMKRQSALGRGLHPVPSLFPHPLGLTDRKAIDQPAGS
ncbi:hypothetical protein D3C73_1357050 [compost metagenome]